MSQDRNNIYFQPVMLRLGLCDNAPDSKTISLDERISIWIRWYFLNVKFIPIFIHGTVHLTLCGKKKTHPTVLKCQFINEGSIMLNL